jgi:hypothetical protein
MQDVEEIFDLLLKKGFVVWGIDYIDDLEVIFSTLLSSEFTTSDISKIEYLVDLQEVDLLSSLKWFVSNLQPNPFYKIIDQFESKNGSYYYAIPYSNDYTPGFYISAVEELFDKIESIEFEMQKIKFLEKKFGFSKIPNLTVRNGGSFDEIKHDYLFSISQLDFFELDKVHDPFFHHLHYLGKKESEYFFTPIKLVNDTDYIIAFLNSIKTSKKDIAMEKVHDYTILFKRILSLPAFVKYYIEKEIETLF